MAMDRLHQNSIKQDYPSDIRLNFSLRILDRSEMSRPAQRWLCFGFGDIGKSNVGFFDIQMNTNDSSF